MTRYLFLLLVALLVVGVVAGLGGIFIVIPGTPTATPDIRCSFWHDPDVLALFGVPDRHPDWCAFDGESNYRWDGWP